MKNKIIRKSMLVWLGILPLAIANGALREYLLLPLLGNIGFPISGILLAAMIYAMAFFFLPRLGHGTAVTYRTMGILWVLCTIVFETLLGLLGGDSWDVILGNYNFLTGNIWVFVVIFTGFVPWLAAKVRKII